MMVLLGLAITIIVVLAAIAGRYLWQVRQQAAENELKQQALAQKQAEQRVYLIESLQLIAGTVVNNDLNLSEATIRCKVLLDALLLPAEIRAPFEVLDEVYEHLQGFDTHEQRKKLTSAERKAQDQSRIDIEGRYRQQLLGCFQQLVTFQPPA
ncbi:MULTISPECIES: DUF2489 domain-containing protein [Reinekea]|jgi:hypothetical protein|uniref:DUF2489 domain-containing protein n=1 Tax=Reinekea forsetii TaxID=1336806 RepID=A0A2K8KV25_9GAMM|nr:MULTISPECIES: DUF2489 domain-containing protein [Reinekea]ATX77134.1 hypothetical protein REIFOR_01999 [Reinekea forsetii]MDO7640927.1 DUF2489 domain-containing protein [Reinekea forsetii]MDO7645661.1 DUF2489 domain-containing protein [Reinekea forsetii]